MFVLGIPYANYTKSRLFVCLILQKNTFVCFSIDRPKTNIYNRAINQNKQTNKHGGNKQMTLEKLRQITNTLPADTIILIDTEDINEVETINIEYHADGRAHLILSNKE